MKIKTESQKLEKTLRQLLSAGERRTTIPILSHALLEPGFATMSDLAVTLRLPLEGEFSGEGRACVQAAKLYAAVRLLSGEVVLEADSGQVRVAGSGSRFRLNALDASGFPSVEAPADGAGKLPFAVLRRVLERVAPAVSTEESRYTLNSVLLESDSLTGRLRAVATDGHRLAIAEESLEQPLELEPILFPLPAVRVLLALEAETVGLSATERVLFVSLPKGFLAVTRPTGKFPNYQAVLPTENQTQIKVEAGALRQAITRARTVVDERSRAVKFEFAPERASMTVTAESAEFGDFDESVAISGEGPAVKVAFNADYLLDFLKQVEGTVSIGLRDADSAGDFRLGESYRYIVMPLRA